jgi:cytoskeletal protein CcmA (bactofilin family)
MFSKPTKAVATGIDTLTAVPAEPSSTAKKALKVASLIASELTIEGSITGEGELHIDGTVKGDVRVAKLTVGETGHVDGAVHAEGIEVRGRVIGSITAKQVRLYGTSYVDGDITHEQLAMETGAFFQGRSLKFQRPPPVIAPPASAPKAAAPTPEPAEAEQN